MIGTLLLVALSFLLTSCGREYLLAALNGFERGATAPQTICTTRYQSHKGNGAYYTNCTTY